MSNDKMREEFEVALRQAISQGICVAEDSAVAWAFFAASREALFIELPDEDGMQGHLWAPDVVAAIEAAGVKVKP